MRRLLLRLLGAVASIFAAVITAFWLAPPAGAQSAPEAYTATLIASEAVAGSGAGMINIRLISRTSEDEQKNVKEAFQKSDAEGLALLTTMSKGYINIEGQEGRKVLRSSRGPAKVVTNW